jgi:hypothetical protein
MRYIAPVTDRSAADIANKTAKAFFNVADWQRVHNNAQVTKALVDFLLSINVTFDAVIEPTIATVPTVAQLNALLGNIDRLRIESSLPAITGLAEITSDWQSGTGANAPDYLDANEWEQVLDVILNSVAKAVEYQIYCGVANVGQMRFYQSRWRKYAWVQNAVSPVRSHRTGIAVSGAGITWNNGFRRYN